MPKIKPSIYLRHKVNSVYFGGEWPWQESQLHSVANLIWRTGDLIIQLETGRLPATLGEAMAGDYTIRHPCIGICSTTSFGDDICRGCGRTAEIVRDWNGMKTWQKVSALADQHVIRMTGYFNGG